jgi:hypothetical protein
MMQHVTCNKSSLFATMPKALTKHKGRNKYPCEINKMFLNFFRHETLIHSYNWNIKGHKDWKKYCSFWFKIQQ